jgi:succinate-semialdehyde dehydrogenase/glutarate-semialdehyde dehydrogenase
VYQVVDPSTGELISDYPTVTWNEAETTAREVHRAFLAWRKLSFSQRKARILRLAKLLKKDKTKFARLMTQEMGKPISQSENEIDKCVWGCEFYAKNGESYLKPAVVKTDARKSYVRYDPIGVVFGIMPWNFPFWQVFRFSVPALMAGNGALLKHAPNVPGCAMAIEALYQKAGVPVFRSLFLSNDDAARLIASPFVQGVSLTGSGRAGSEVASVAGKSLKKTVLELGGSDPFIVLADADLAKTVPAGVRGRMLNSGQSCIAAKRFIIVEKIFSKFQKLFVEEVRKLKVGEPTNRANDVGPLAREDLLENLERQVEKSVSQGAKVLIGGSRLKGKGFFYLPTVLTDVGSGMVCFTEEIFGPVASLIVAKNDEEAIQLANETSYGLGASLWTKNRKRAEMLAARIEAGSVFINGTVKSDPRLPFGGIKQSGYGRELSSPGMHEFVNIKTVWVA